MACGHFEQAEAECREPCNMLPLIDVMDNAIFPEENGFYLRYRFHPKLTCLKMAHFEEVCF